MDRNFSLSHIGTLNAARNPKSLWKVLGEMVRNDEAFREEMKIQLIGKVDFSVLEELEKNGLNGNLVKIDYLSHSEAIKKQQSSQILLLLINNSQNAKGVLTGKFFEYLSSGRPVFAVGPSDGDVADVLHETRSGRIADFDDEKTMKLIVQEYFEMYKKGNLAVDSHSIEKYSRRDLTRQLADLLNQL